jgi:ATP-dependent Lon protease
MPDQDKLSNVVNDQLQVMPVLPLRDVVVYPFMVIPLFVGREKSILALEAAMEEEKQILLVAQKMLHKMNQRQKTCTTSVLLPIFSSYLNCQMALSKC